MGSSPKEVKEVALGFHLSSLLPVHVLPAPCQGLFKGATGEADYLPGPAPDGGGLIQVGDTLQDNTLCVSPD